MSLMLTFYQQGDRLARCSSTVCMVPRSWASPEVPNSISDIVKSVSSDLSLQIQTKYIYVWTGCPKNCLIEKKSLPKFSAAGPNLPMNIACERLILQ